MIENGLCKANVLGETVAFIHENGKVYLCPSFIFMEFTESEFEQYIEKLKKKASN